MVGQDRGFTAPRRCPVPFAPSCRGLSLHGYDLFLAYLRPEDSRSACCKKLRSIRIAIRMDEREGRLRTFGWQGIQVLECDRRNAPKKLPIRRAKFSSLVW